MVTSELGAYGLVQRRILGRVSAHALGVYVVLSVYAAGKQEHDCWPEIMTIATDAGLSERAVQRAIKELSEKDVIRVSKRLDVRGIQTSNLYHVLVLSPEWEASHPRIEREIKKRDWGGRPCNLNQGIRKGVQYSHPGGVSTAGEEYQEKNTIYSSLTGEVNIREGCNPVPVSPSSNRMRFIKGLIGQLNIIQEANPPEGYIKSYRIEVPWDPQESMLLSYDQLGSIKLTYFKTDPNFITQFCEALKIRHTQLYVNPSMKLKDQIKMLTQTKGPVYLLERFQYGKVKTDKLCLPIYIPSLAKDTKTKTIKQQMTMRQISEYMGSLKNREVFVVLKEESLKEMGFYKREFGDWKVDVDCLSYKGKLDMDSLEPARWFQA